MVSKKYNNMKQPPCPRCLYTLGQVHTLTNPCPRCKEDGYQMSEWFGKRLPGHIPDSKKER